MVWLIRVLIVTTSPAAAFFGVFTRGFTPDAIVFISYALAAAAADCDLYGRLCLNEAAICHLGDRNNVLRASQTNSGGCGLRTCSSTEIESGHARCWVSGRKNHDRRCAGRINRNRNS